MGANSTSDSATPAAKAAAGSGFMSLPQSLWLVCISGSHWVPPYHSPSQVEGKTEKRQEAQKRDRQMMFVSPSNLEERKRKTLPRLLWPAQTQIELQK